MRNTSQSLAIALTCALSASPAAHIADTSGAGGPTVMRRITAAQYRNIMTDVFGDDIVLGGRFEPDLRVDHLVAIGAGQASVTASGLEQYDRIARSIGAQVADVQHRAQEVQCTPASATAPDAGCTRMFVTRVGRLLYRRPLSAAEVEGYVNAAAAATKKTGDYYGGVALALAGILESPQFL
ncbi:MAG TPA: DUF1595 domain-containing protein, partial [Vicinamibacterales bacterium]|nr:DUF1595 domain-containing protein [Vicinamibacterales bacterium]